MARRRLRTAISLASAATTIAAIVHDRQATALPANAIVRVIETDDPYDRTTRINVVQSIRDDPLGRLHAHKQIDEAQYQGGLTWQRHYQHSQLWPSAELKDPVDGRGAAQDGFVRMADACRILRECHVKLGDEGDALVRMVLGERWFLVKVAYARGLNPDAGSRDMAYLGRRLAECLNTLAKHFHYA